MSSSPPPGPSSPSAGVGYTLAFSSPSPANLADSWVVQIPRPPRHATSSGQWEADVLPPAFGTKLVTDENGAVWIAGSRAVYSTHAGVLEGAQEYPLPHGREVVAASLIKAGDGVLAIYNTGTIGGRYLTRAYLMNRDSRQVQSAQLESVPGPSAFGARKWSMVTGGSASVKGAALLEFDFGTGNSKRVMEWDWWHPPGSVSSETAPVSGLFRARGRFYLVVQVWRVDGSGLVSPFSNGKGAMLRLVELAPESSVPVKSWLLGYFDESIADTRDGKVNAVAAAALGGHFADGAFWYVNSASQVMRVDLQARTQSLAFPLPKCLDRADQAAASWTGDSLSVVGTLEDDACLVEMSLHDGAIKSLATIPGLGRWARERGVVPTGISSPPA